MKNDTEWLVLTILEVLTNRAGSRDSELRFILRRKCFVWKAFVVQAQDVSHGFCPFHSHWLQTCVKSLSPPVHLKHIVFECVLLF